MLNLTQQDIELLAAKGISEDKLVYQLNQFKTGFPFLKLSATAAPGYGVKICSEEECGNYLSAWDSYLSKGEGKVLKFVPASGAASRMFKDLFEYLDRDNNIEDNSFVSLFTNVKTTGLVITIIWSPPVETGLRPMLTTAESSKKEY